MLAIPILDVLKLAVAFPPLTVTVSALLVSTAAVEGSSNDPIVVTKVTLVTPVASTTMGNVSLSFMVAGSAVGEEI